MHDIDILIRDMEAEMVYHNVEADTYEEAAEKIVNKLLFRDKRLRAEAVEQRIEAQKYEKCVHYLKEIRRIEEQAIDDGK